MAWEHVKAAFRYEEGDIGETAMHLLLRLSFELRDNAYVYMGTEKLGKWMRCSRKTVLRALRELENAGLVAVRSGRYEGHTNHIYLTYPGVEQHPVPPVAASFVKLSTSYPHSVDKLASGSREAAPMDQNGTPGVGQNDHEVCQSGFELGQEGREGWDKNGAGEIKSKTKEVSQSENTCSPAQNDTPPLRIGKLPPVGTVEFKAHVIHFCLEAGASLVKARQFYERHQGEAWAVLEHMPLEVAIREFVADWKREDARAWTLEQLGRMKTPIS